MGHRYQGLAVPSPRLAPHLCDLVVACLDRPEASTLRQTTLAMFAEQIGFDEGHFVQLDSTFFSEAPAYLRHFLDDPSYAADLRPAVLAGGARGAYVDTEVYSPRERERLRLFGDLVRPHGIESQLVALVRREGSVVGIIHLNRHGASGRANPFSPEDLHLVTQALPLVQILQGGLGQCSSEGLVGLVSRLTPRQLDIALLVAEGYQNAQVAALLGLSERTVRNQVSMIFHRLTVFSRAEVALLCDRAGLLRQPAHERASLARLARHTVDVLALT